MKNLRWNILLISLFLCSACLARGESTSGIQTGQPIRVVAVESFLADIAQRVAGERLVIEILISPGIDPHAFEPTPKDLAKISTSSVLIINGAGLEEWISKTLENVGGQRLVIEASRGLTGRKHHENELSGDDHEESTMDPHFWLDPNLVVQYTKNIRDGLIEADPEGKELYSNNAEAYILELVDLDGWIRQQVAQIPLERRLLVTNHESFGYFADRYGFQIIGTVIPSVSTGASTSAKQLANLIDRIKQTGAPAIFLETGTNPQLAEQIARETGVKVVHGLSSHSLTVDNGEAATYLTLMKYNVRAIVEALK